MGAGHGGHPTRRITTGNRTRSHTGNRVDDGRVAAGQAKRAAHWDRVYRRGESALSWYEAEPFWSLRMLDVAQVDSSATVIDVGGGTARLVDALLDREFFDVSVLDVSTAALGEARRRLAARADRVHWLVADVLGWRPGRRYDVWHDRAVFHFQVEAADRASYLAVLAAGTHPGSVAVLGTFAPDGPAQCSGLPVARYDLHQLVDTLGSRWEPLVTDREQHITPQGVTQAFTWSVVRRRPFT